MAEIIDLGEHVAQLEDVQRRFDLWAANKVDGLDIPMTFPPALAFAGATIEDQITSVFSEARELADALTSNDPMWLMEAMDLHHALETLWRIIVLAHGPDPLNNARAMCIQKNAERGYYLEAPEGPDQ